jgi:hypothetical protein
MSAPTLLEKIAELEAKIRGYEEEYNAAETPEDKRGLRELINTTTNRLIGLEAEARAAATAGKCMYFILVYIFFLTSQFCCMCFTLRFYYVFIYSAPAPGGMAPGLAYI